MRSHRFTRSILACGVFVAAFALAASAPAAAQKREDDGGRASKNGLTEGKIGATEVTITYGRPKVRGRTIWGNLVPFGKVWRAGADEATTITFSKPVKIEGKDVPAGTYGLFFIPEKEEWTVVLNKIPKQWGAFRYAEAEDQLRVKVKPTMSDTASEELTYEIAGDKVVLKWEKVAVPVTITAA
jgi:hypothetical protein